MENIFMGKTILITGGAGTIGRKLAEELLKYEPQAVRIFDIDETGIFEMENELHMHKNLRYLIGDVRDKNRLRSAMHGVHTVFHAAALKHVKSNEYNPFECVKTNVVGVQNLIDVCIEEGVEKVVFTSSDKAANPTNVMGTTKLLGERLFTAANYYKGKTDIKFSSVRFGNVVGSRGSAVLLFKKQIKNGDYLTVTDTEMTRFIMSAKDAISLILESAVAMKGGEVFILKMPAFRLGDMINAVIEEISPNYSKIKDIGTKPGEKPYEELMTTEESKRSLETEKMFILLPEMKELLQRNDYTYENARKAPVKSYTTGDAEFLSKDDIKRFLREAQLI